MAKHKSGRRIIAIVLLVIVAAGVFFVLRRPKPRKYRTATVTRGEILAQVSATGTLNPIDAVTVGSQVSGIVDTVLVDYNDQVKAGQVLARIDRRNYEAARVQAEANLTSARVSLAQAERDLRSAETLARTNMISADQLFQAQTTYELARAKLAQAEASYEQALTNLAYTTITAPMSGLVIARKVQNGQTVAASFSAPELFTIADLSRMQVEVSIQEADIGKLDTGLVATFKVDAYPGRSFEGKLVQIRNEPITNANVVTYIGIVHVDNPDYLLKPGMTADVKIEVSHVADVLVVPTNAFNAKLGTTLGLEPARTGPAVARVRAPAPGATQPGTERRGPTDTPKPITRTAYVLERGRPRARSVEIGASDSYNTEVRSGLEEGEVVILGLEQARANPFMQQQQQRGPGMRFP